MVSAICLASSRVGASTSPRTVFSAGLPPSATSARSAAGQTRRSCRCRFAPAPSRRRRQAPAGLPGPDRRPHSITRHWGQKLLASRAATTEAIWVSQHADCMFSDTAAIKCPEKPADRLPADMRWRGSRQRPLQAMTGEGTTTRNQNCSDRCETPARTGMTQMAFTRRAGLRTNGPRETRTDHMANPLYDQLFARHAGRDTAFLHLADGRTLTYDAFLRMAARFAHALRGTGLAPGERLAAGAEIGRGARRLCGLRAGGDCVPAAQHRLYP